MVSLIEKKKTGPFNMNEIAFEKLVLDAIVRRSTLSPRPLGKGSPLQQGRCCSSYLLGQKSTEETFFGTFYVTEAIKTWQEILCCTSLGVKKIHVT